MKRKATLLLTERVGVEPRMSFGLSAGYGIDTILPGLVDQRFIFDALGRRRYRRALELGVLVPVRRRGTGAAREYWWPWSEAWD